jgi:hypothetical protein
MNTVKFVLIMGLISVFALLMGTKMSEYLLFE